MTPSHLSQAVLSARRVEFADMDLRKLVQPTDPEAFRREYWERRPFILSRKDPHFYKDVLTLEDADAILADSSVWRSSHLRIVRDGHETPLQELQTGDTNQSEGGVEALYQEYRKGSTIVFVFLQERWAPLRRLCQSLSAELSAAVQVNVYLTPPSERGFKPHYDTHDVFVLQASGSKRWRIYPAPLRLPLAQQPCDPNALNLGAPLEEVTLDAGDLLYLPRGYVHEANSLAATSLHMTVGVRPVTWASVITDSVAAVVEGDARFREGLPPGFARDSVLERECVTHLQELLTAAFSGAQAVTAIADARRRAVLAQQPSLEGHLLDLEATRTIGPDSPMRIRSDLRWDMSIRDEELWLSFHGKTVRMPAHVERDLQIMKEARRFCPGELATNLDLDSRLVLVRRLLSEGFLTFDREALQFEFAPPAQGS